MLAHRMRRAGAKGLSSLSFHASTSNIDSATITIPATAQAGDLAILIDYAYFGGTTPTLATPSGWTAWSGSGQTLDSGFDAWAGQMSYKILQSGDPNSSITGINGSNERKILLVFRGDKPIGLLSPSTANGVLIGTNPTAQTVSANGQPVPLVVIGAAGENGATFSTASPAFDATVTVSNSHLIAGYKIYNSSPADHTIDMNDVGSGNYLASGFIGVS